MKRVRRYTARKKRTRLSGFDRCVWRKSLASCGSGKSWNTFRIGAIVVVGMEEVWYRDKGQGEVVHLGPRPAQSSTPDTSPELRGMDARQLLALQDASSLPTAADVALRKVAAYNGIPRRSKHERERDAAAKKQAEEDEYAAVAYDEYVAAFGLEEEGNSGRSSGKGFVRAGGGGYDPVRDGQASGSAQRGTVAVPTAPRAVMGRQTAASLMSAAADVRLVLSSVLVRC